MEYNEDSTYLVIEIKSNLPMRWEKSGELFYAGSLTDAMIDLPINEFVAKPVKDCSEELQKEYRKLIDKEL